MMIEKPGRSRVLSAAGILALALAAVFPAASMPSARARGDVAGELQELKNRIRSLEEAIAAEQAKRAAAVSPSPPPAVEEEARESFHTGPWAQAEEPPGSTPKETIDGLLALAVKGDGSGLVGAIQKQLAAGDKGHEVLQDFLHALDKNPSLAKRLVGRYDLAFALMHPAMMQEEGWARLAHTYLSVTRKTTRTVLRGYLYSFLPVFLEFHRGRFPDLEEALTAEILQLVQGGDKRLRLLFSAAESLGYFLPIDLVERRLTQATDFQAHSALLLHLGARDDKDAVRVLKHFISQNMRRYGGAVSQALVTLVKMSAPGVEQVFRELTWTKDAFTYSKAIRAYFAIPRHEGFAPEARRYLNSRVSFPDKRLFINQLRRVNPGILDELRQLAEQITSDEVREFLLK